MAIITRTWGVAVLTGMLGTGLGLLLFRRSTDEDAIIPCLLPGCVGAILGAVAGVAREIIAAQRG